MLKKNGILKENILISTLDNGIKCYIIPKKDYVTKECAIVVGYGANDINFKVDDSNYKSFSGTAHFIEHKLFAKPEGDIFSLFSKQGAKANAYTDFGKTVYYFSCTDDFYENLKTLIYMVKKPYFTKENVESEKSIIKQEITMYEDNPDWCVYYNMLSIMYHNHNVKNKIAGTCESVEKIDEKMLNKCYNSFYTPKNIGVVCVGDFPENDVLELLKSEFSDFYNTSEAICIYGDESEDIVEKYIETKMDIKETFFSVGYKLPKYFFESDVKKSFAVKMIGDILFGEGSEFYNKLYNEGKVRDSLGMEFVSGKEFAFFVIAGNSDFPDDIAEGICFEFDKAKENGVLSVVFDRIKNKLVSKFIRGLNSVDAITMAQVNFYTNNTDISDAYDKLMEIDLEYINNVLKEGFYNKNMVLSVIKPK